ncbi:hypothetical protein ACLMJK_008082 [Lecanora helva]
MTHDDDVFKELESTIETRSLELAYENACYHVERVYDSEKVRQLKVQISILEDENGGLRSRMAQQDDGMIGLEKRNSELQEDLEVMSASLDSAYGDLRIRTREIETLKAELNSLQGVTMDSTKLLTEKLTLARELSSLRPEVEHLRSQAASHQSLLAENLSLQRQVNTIQVELEKEKCSTERILAKEKNSQAEEAGLESQLNTLQTELGRERRERQKMDHEAQKAIAESETRRTALESRLDAFRTKLKATKEQLKETHKCLELAQSATSASAATAKRPSAQNSSVNSLRKRTAMEIDDDTMIGTPGVLPAAKKRKNASSLVGEKSTFSITPFLNRTASIAPGRTSSEKIGSDSEASLEPENCASGPDKLTSMNEALGIDLGPTKKAIQLKEPAVVKDTRSSKAGTRVSQARNKKVTPALEQVQEEEDTENYNSAVTRPRVLENLGTLDESCDFGARHKRKPRKLLGSKLATSLSDDGEDDTTKADRGMLLTVKDSSKAGRSGSAGPQLGPRKALGHKISTFGAISPLKRDRKVII